MTDFTIETVDCKADAFEREIIEVLDKAAVEADRPFVETPLNLRACDGAGGFLGGLAGNDLQGWFYVKLLAVTPRARGLGVGRALMARAETMARERGLIGVYVDTFDFQAPAFYAGIGYEEIGRLPATQGHPARIWFAKAF